MWWAILHTPTSLRNVTRGRGLTWEAVQKLLKPPRNFSFWGRLTIDLPKGEILRCLSGCNLELINFKLLWVLLTPFCTGKQKLRPFVRHCHFREPPGGLESFRWMIIKISENDLFFFLLNSAIGILKRHSVNILQFVISGNCKSLVVSFSFSPHQCLKNWCDVKTRLFFFF